MYYNPIVISIELGKEKGRFFLKKERRHSCYFQYKIISTYWLSM